jgi:hypothetical protein
MTAAAEEEYGLALDPAQGRLVMEALGERPFRTVYRLIGRLNAWAGAAFPRDCDAHQAPAVAFALTLPDLALVLDALGYLPHRRVYRLVASLEGQLQQLQAGGGR